VTTLRSLLLAVGAAAFAGGGDGSQYLEMPPEPGPPPPRTQHHGRARSVGYAPCPKCKKKRSLQSSYCQHCGDRK
jgi:hypothetical protein